MHIPVPENSVQCDTAMRESLERFINHPEPALVPPCSGCVKHVPKDCSPQCNDAPQALSIDPVRYPLEPKVVPMVFEVTASAGLKTCWSCEGHMNIENELWKVPQVCFYSDKTIYPRLVLMHLSNLIQDKKLKYPWHIVLIDFSLSPDITYSIQPNLNHISEPRLGSLQQDMQIIAEDMHAKLKDIARDFLNKFC